MLVLLAGLHGVVSINTEVPIGSGTAYDPFTWGGGELGVTGDCQVYRRVGGNWELALSASEPQPETGELVSETPPPPIYEGSGTENSPYKILTAVKGLVCYRAEERDFEGCVSWKNDVASEGLCEKEGHVLWRDAPYGKKDENGGFFYPLVRTGSGADFLVPDLSREILYGQKEINLEGAATVEDLAKTPLIFIMYYYGGKWNYKAPQTTTGGGAAAGGGGVAVPPQTTEEYIDFSYSNLQSVLGEDQPGFAGGGIYIPQGIQSGGVEPVDVFLLFTGRRDQELSTRIGESITALPPEEISQYRYYFGNNDVQRFDLILKEHIAGGGKPVILVELLGSDLEKPYRAIDEAQYNHMIAGIEEELKGRGISNLRYNLLTFSYSSSAESQVISRMFNVLGKFNVVAIGESTTTTDYLKGIVNSNLQKFSSLVFVWRGNTNFPNDKVFHEYIDNRKDPKLATLSTSGISHQQVPAKLFKKVLDSYFHAPATSQPPIALEAEEDEVSPSESPAEEPAVTILTPENQRVKEIDEVWEIIGDKIRNSKDIWDLATKSWKPFSQIYQLLQQIPPGPGGVSSYEEVIGRAAAQSSIDAALIKAIIKHESRFNPNVISTTGCVGLMQICKTSADPTYIRQISGQPTAGAVLKNLPGCCELESGESKAYPCEQERKKCGNSPEWCAAGLYRCNPTNDDRFNSEKNIMNVASNLQKKKNHILAIYHTCGNECLIAANNIGEGVIIKAAAQTPTRSWSEIYNKINPQIMNEASNTYASWSSEDKQKKINGLKSYVSKVMQSYNQYQFGVS